MKDPKLLEAIASTAEECGFDSLWASEAYGSNALTTLGFVAARTKRIRLGTAILPIWARTPASTAMGATTLDSLSSGRAEIGLGVSGPQVVEGWFGRPFRRPLNATREYVSILREAIARKGPLTAGGEEFPLPYQGPGSVGLGKPLKLSVVPPRERIPIGLAGMGPKNVEMIAEIADFWLPLFISPERWDVFASALQEGKKSRVHNDPLTVAVTVPVELGDDLAMCRWRLKKYYALYFGGMGSRSVNFHSRVLATYGLQDLAREIQDAFVNRDHDAAAHTIPDAFVDEFGLAGPSERIFSRLNEWKRHGGIHRLLLRCHDVKSLQELAGYL